MSRFLSHMVAITFGLDKWSLSVNLTINGKDHYDLPDPLSVFQLLAHFELPEKKIAVELNREIVPKSTFETAMLSDGDKLEIIHFIGGG